MKVGVGEEPGKRTDYMHMLKTSQHSGITVYLAYTFSPPHPFPYKSLGMRLGNSLLVDCGSIVV